jgi:arabinofuranan 3-O-arabinosyltransferase
VDGDPLTAWISDPEAGAPALTLRWDGPVPVDSIDITALTKETDPVHRVVVTVDGTSYERELTGTGQVAIPTTLADEITLAFPGDPGDVTGTRQVAIAEVAVSGLLGRTATTLDRSTPVDLGCGDGPPVSVDGTVVATRASTTVGGLLDGSPVDWAACGPVPLDRGTHRVTAVAGSLLVSTLVIEPADGVPPAPAARSVSTGHWDREDRTVRIGSGDDAILATTENFNEGWVATVDGTVLQPIRVDGWRQGWRVPAGDAATVHLRYRPAVYQRIGLILGVVALAALVAAALVAPRRRPAGTVAAAAGSEGESSWRVLGERPWPAAVAVVLAAAAGVALGGPVGLVAVVLWFVPNRDRWLPVVAAAGTVGAGVVAFAGAGAELGDALGTFSGPAQALAATAVVAAGLALVPGRQGSAGPAGDEPAGDEPVGS